VKNPNIRRIILPATCPITPKTRAFAPFARFGTPHAKQSASADRPPDGSRGIEMTAFSTYSQRIVAGFAAIAISALLFANTLATSAAQVHSVAGILA
jgi:hypothetical protein